MFTKKKRNLQVLFIGIVDGDWPLVEFQNTSVRSDAIKEAGQFNIKSYSREAFIKKGEHYE